MKVESSDLVFRQAVAGDLSALVALFAADALGGHGDTTDAAAFPDYQAAFERICQSANDRLFVTELHGEVVGTFQMTLITSLTARGSINLTVEAVQTRSDMRGRGIGEAMIRHAIAFGESMNVRQVQLTSNNARQDAHRFYARLGFAQSHAGFKMRLK